MKFTFKYRRGGRLADYLPTWEEIVMVAVLFITWWIVDGLFPERSLGKSIGVIASLASFALIVWVSVLQKRRKKRKIRNRYQRRVDALKADDIPVTHQNMYNKSIRPDFPIDG